MKKNNFMAYSLDLRERIVASYQSGNFTQIELADYYELSLSTIKRYLKQYRETGLLTTKTDKITGRPSLVDDEGLETIEKLIKANPSITLADLSKEYFKKHHSVAGRSVLSRACQKLNLRRKKLSTYAQERERDDVKKKT